MSQPAWPLNACSRRQATFQGTRCIDDGQVLGPVAWFFSAFRSRGTRYPHALCEKLAAGSATARLVISGRLEARGVVPIERRGA
jgi:hypothetical protein